jgi:hypothetical protein
MLQLAQIKKNIEDNNDIRLCPLNVCDKALLPLIELHLQYVNCCLPVPVRIYHDQADVDGRFFISHEAKMNEVSRNFKYQRSSFMGKEDYKNAADLFRDLYWATWNQRFSKAGESRERGWDYLEVYVLPVREYPAFGRTSYRFFEHDVFTGNIFISFTFFNRSLEGGWIPINQFIPSYLRIITSAQTFVSDKLPKLIKEGKIPLDYLPRECNIESALSTRVKSNNNNDRTVNYAERKLAMNSAPDGLILSTYTPYTVNINNIPNAQQFDKMLVKIINKMKGCSPVYATETSQKRKAEMLECILRIDDFADTALWGSTDPDVEIRTETTVENLRTTPNVSLKAITYTPLNSADNTPSYDTETNDNGDKKKRRRKRRLLNNCTSGPLYPALNDPEEDATEI